MHTNTLLFGDCGSLARRTTCISRISSYTYTLATKSSQNFHHGLFATFFFFETAWLGQHLVISVDSSSDFMRTGWHIIHSAVLGIYFRLTPDWRFKNIENRCSTRTATATMADHTGQEDAVSGQDHSDAFVRRERNYFGGGGLHGPSFMPKFELPKLGREQSQIVPFTPNVEQEFIAENKSKRNIKSYAGGAALGGMAGGLAGAGAGAVMGAGVGIVVGSIIGSVVPGPGTALGALIGTSVGAGIGGLAGGGAGGGTGTAVGAAIVAKFKKKKDHSPDH